ncbi:hypothetical protein JXO59_02825, partial [candidate division KSB1 bacterium]|nr:hypothetical protein [candidate division KSB1 bacterium]
TDPRRVRLQAAILLLQGKLKPARDILNSARPSYNTFMFIDLYTPNFPLEDHTAVDVHLASGDTAAAIRACDRMIQYHLDNRIRLVHPRLYYRKARLCESAGRIEEAAQSYATYLNIMRGSDTGIAEVVEADQRLEQLRQRYPAPDEPGGKNE